MADTRRDRLLAVMGEAEMSMTEWDRQRGRRPGVLADAILLWVDAEMSEPIGEACHVILALCCASASLAGGDPGRWEAAAVKAEAWVAKYIDGSEEVTHG